MQFRGSYLRVLTPRTSDGITPLLVNGSLVYKEDFLALSAKKYMEEQNSHLPDILKKKIEVIGSQESATSKTTVKK